VFHLGFGKKENDSLLIELGTDLVRAILYSIEYDGKMIKAVTVKGEATEELKVPSGYLNPILAKVNTKMSFSSGNDDVLPVIVHKEAIRRVILEAMPISFRDKYSRSSLDVIASLTNKIAVVLSPAMARGRVDELIIDRSSDLLINGEEEEKTYSWIKSEIKKKTEEDVSSTGLMPEEIVSNDTRIESMKIDGYAVNRLAGYKGKRIEFEVMSLMAFNDYYNELKTIFCDSNAGVKSNFKNILCQNKIKITHGGSLMAPIVKAKKITGTIIAIQERWTQVLIANAGVITEIIDINFGDQHFCRAIEDRLGISINEARRLKEDYLSCRLSEKARRAIHEIINEAAGAWFSKIHQQIIVSEETKNEPGVTNRIFSDKIFLMGESATLTELKMVIENNWQEAFVSSPRISVINYRTVIDWLTETNNRMLYKDLTGRVSGSNDIKIICGLLYGLS